MNKMKKSFALLLTIIMMLSQFSGAVFAVPAAPEIGVGELEEGEGRLIKIAEPIAGSVNQWKVTVRMEYKDKPQPADILVSLDRSGSMMDGDRIDGKVQEYAGYVEGDSKHRMTMAKTTLKQLTNKVLAPGTPHKMAMHSYSYFTVSQQGAAHTFHTFTRHTQFTADKKVIEKAIDEVKPKGGTFTQRALHEARKVMADEKRSDTEGKRKRHLILVTDGRPTVGYAIDTTQLNNDTHFDYRTGLENKSDYIDLENKVQCATKGDETEEAIASEGDKFWYGNGRVPFKSEEPYDKNNVPNFGYVSNRKIPISAFEYDDTNDNNRIGWGGDSFYAIKGYGNINPDKYEYWNISEHTIAEAEALKASGLIDNLYIVGFVTDEETNRYLKDMASQGKFYPTNMGNMQKTIDAIYSDMLDQTIQQAEIVDYIGDGFELVKNSIECKIGDEADNAKAKEEVKIIPEENGKNACIKWNFQTPKNVKDETAYPKERWAEITYTVKLKEGWHGFYESKNGIYETNGDTNVTIKDGDPEDKTYPVESPKVVPVKYTIQKELQDASGAKKTDATKNFSVTVTGPNGYKKDFTLKSDGVVIGDDLTTPGTYTVKENNAEDYAVTFKVKIGKTEKTTKEFTIDKNMELKDAENDGINNPTITIINKEKERRYNVTYEFKSGTPNKDLPEDVKKLLPKDADTYPDGTQVISKTPKGEWAESEPISVKVTEGTWTFTGYHDPKTNEIQHKQTINGADIKFIGTWVFEEDTPTPPPTPATYKVIHEFKSGTPNKDLPEDVKKLLPVDQTDKKDGDTVTPTEPNFKSVKVSDGTWNFKSYDENEKVIAGKDQKFIGTWVFEGDTPTPPPTPVTYKVIHEFKSGTPNKDLPEDVKKLLPVDQTDKKDGDTVTPTEPNFKSVKVSDGTWNFKSYDENEKVIAGKDQKFIGTWEFTPSPTPNEEYKVTYEYQSDDPNTLLPDAIKNSAPNEVTGKKNGDEVHSPDPKENQYADEENDGMWTFQSYDHTDVTINGENKHVIGTWKFTANKYKVTHQFKSRTFKKESPNELMELPKEVMELLPVEQADKLNKEVVHPTQPIQSEVEVPGGKWVFDTYGEETRTINKADEEFIGTWVFVEIPPTTGSAITIHVEEETEKELAPQENGRQDKKYIEGYDYVRTEEDKDGNVKHIYKKKSEEPYKKEDEEDPKKPEPKDPDPKDPDKPSKPSEPSKPSKPSEPSKPVEPKKPEVPEEPKLPETPTDWNTPSSNDNIPSKKPDKPSTQSDIPSKKKDTPSTKTDIPSKKTDTIPQTGDESTASLWLMLTLLSSLGFVILEKRRVEE